MQKSNPCFSHGCSKCCYDTEMPLLESDVARLEAAGHTRDEFVVRVGDGIQLRNVDGHCVFLKGGLCSVHESRPEGCRLYPLVMVDGRPDFDDFCPFFKEFNAYITMAPELQRVVSRLSSEEVSRKGDRTVR